MSKAGLTNSKFSRRAIRPMIDPHWQLQGTWTSIFVFDFEGRPGHWRPRNVSNRRIGSGHWHHHCHGQVHLRQRKYRHYTMKPKNP